MRFYSDGPWIPDELLVARDEGRVVFFCGAGVSRARAGLLDFFGLAEKVTNGLGVVADDPVRKLLVEARDLDLRIGLSGLISADRVFGLLERDFIVREIEKAVAGALKPDENVDLSAHQIMLDLSRTSDGKRRLVTTNFDVLFESCDDTLPCHKPPRLPDPSRDDEFQGIIHLHGHVDPGYRGACGDGFVLSSSEFGNAYLADGWATKFILSILEKYTVVFVGYAADDPPVLYLLEALYRHRKSLNDMYAFQPGSQSEAEAKWRHKGVIPIAYDERENHRILWDSLGAWSHRALAPDAWYDETIRLAQQGPEALLPHQRGMVAHVVSTLEGMRRFSAPEIPPPADWLCVFDPKIRFHKPGHLGSYIEQGPFFDPFEAYGMDSDPVPTKIVPGDWTAKRDIPCDAWNCFAATKLDQKNLDDNNFAALIGHYSANLPGLPKRLWELGVWIARVSYQPASIWWASHQSGLHSATQAHILYELERRQEKSAPDVRGAWRTIFKAWGMQKKDFHEWYKLKGSINLDGWSDATIREVVSIWQPYLEVSSPSSGGPKPPTGVEKISIREMINLVVKYPELHDNVDIPDEYLVVATREFRKNLELAVSLEKELGTYTYLNFCPIEPDPDLNGESSDRHYGFSYTFIFYVDLLKRLVKQNREAARQEYLSWWKEDDNIFDRLRIWAACCTEMTSGAEAGQLICGLNDAVFWDSYHSRDLMLALECRWDSFSSAVRKRVEKRLLKGYRRSRGENKKEYSKWRAWSSLCRIHWLHEVGCNFSFDIETETVRLQNLAPDWQPKYAAKAAASMETRGGFVGTDTAFSVLLDIPIDQILARSREMGGRTTESMVDKDPFAGLAAERPVRAVSALLKAAKRSEWPAWAWGKFLNSPSREKDKRRLSVLIALRLATFPVNVVGGFIHPVCAWLLRASTVLIPYSRETFERIWDHLIKLLKTESGLPKTSLVREGKEPAWATEALNSPVGQLAQVLMNDPQKAGLIPGQGFPKGWVTHVEELLGLAGDNRRYALVMFAYNLSWFFYIDPSWTEENLLSVLGKDENDQKAFWEGYFWHAQQPMEGLLLQLKPWLVQLTQQEHASRRRELNVLSAILLAAWGTCRKSGERLVTNEEMRNILLHSDDDFRIQVIWHLERWTSDEKDNNWKVLLPVFLTDVWPRQKQVKSPKISARLCDLAFSSSDLFSDVADAILPLLSSIEENDLSFPHLRGAKDPLLEKYPEKALAVVWAVLSEKSPKWPYGIENILEKIGIAEPSLLMDPRLVELKRRWNVR